ncbi:hypothetical protein BV25DRAFT_1807463, partial [Artomyces pyxidatus]
MHSTSLSALVLGAVTTAFAAAVPATVYPTVIPGPGLPSLESLNLTSADLYTTDISLGMYPLSSCSAVPVQTLIVGLTEARGELEARYTNECFTYTTASVNNVIACFNYLQSIGSNNCGVVSNIDFCEAGDAQISGSNIAGAGEVSSSCHDVALGVQWIFTNCNNGGQVGGA